ncbi:MAG: hypothetical protein M1813_005412 [Trichoglossum hirsutum]|nr:MAG: hypothetical protein M1813_005412 [Trichoglossum hirsutum]
MQFGLSSPAPSLLAKEEEPLHSSPTFPPIITFNDLRVLAWQIDIDQATRKRHRRAASSAESPPPWKKRRMNSSPTKRQRQDYELPERPRNLAEPNSTSSSTTRTNLTTEDNTLTPSSFATLVDNLVSTGIPRSRTVDSSTISTRLSYIPPLSNQSSRPTSRQPSPSKGGDRKKRVALQYTCPPFKFGWPDNPSDSSDSSGEDDDIQWEGLETQAASEANTQRLTPLPHPPPNPPVPKHISDLIADLSESAATPGSIPSNYRSLIAKYTHNSEPIPPDAFSPPTTESDTLWTHAHTALRTAHALHNERESEASWYPLVHTLLLGPLPPTSTTTPKQRRHCLLLPVMAQTMSVDPSLLPLDGPASEPYAIGTVKVDFLLQFDNKHKAVRPVLEPVLKSTKASFSAFADPVAAKTCTAAVVEVKTPGGDREEGEYQVVVAAAGILRKVEEIRVARGSVGGVSGTLPGEKVEGDREEVMPALGVMVHGHWWEILVVYWEEGAMVSFCRD